MSRSQQKHLDDIARRFSSVGTVPVKNEDPELPESKPEETVFIRPVPLLLLSLLALIIFVLLIAL